MGSDSVTRKAFPMRKAKLRSVELPMKENKVSQKMVVCVNVIYIYIERERERDI